MRTSIGLAAVIAVSALVGLGSCAGEISETPDPLEQADASQPLPRDAGQKPDAGQPPKPDAGQPPKPDAGQPKPDAGPAIDTKFTIAVLPDTQRELNSANKRPRFTNRLTWLVDNKAALDLRFVLQVGDLVDWDTPDHIMYVTASNDLKLLDNAQIPFAIAIGNHDTAAVGVGGSACAGCTGQQVHEGLRNTSQFNATFPSSRFRALKGTFEAGKVDNAYHTFSAGGLDWLVMNLELWARASVVPWANSVLAAHPKHNAILITHAHMTAGGGIDSTNGGYGDSTAQYIYDNLIKQNANVRFVFSGHTGNSGYREDTGVRGNKIYSLLQSYHDEVTNPVRLVEIDTAANTVTTKVYAPFNNETKSDGTYSINNIQFVR